MQSSFASSLFFFLMDLLIFSPVYVKLLTESVWLEADFFFIKTLKQFWTLIRCMHIVPTELLRRKPLVVSVKLHFMARKSQHYHPTTTKLKWLCFSMVPNTLLHLLTFNFCCFSLKELPLSVAQQHFNGNQIKYVHTSTLPSQMNTASPEGKITTYATDCRQSVPLFVSPALCAEKSWIGCKWGKPFSQIHRIVTVTWWRRTQSQEI